MLGGTEFAGSASIYIYSFYVHSRLFAILYNLSVCFSHCMPLLLFGFILLYDNWCVHQLTIPRTATSIWMSIQKFYQYIVLNFSFQFICVCCYLYKDGYKINIVLKQACKIIHIHYLLTCRKIRNSELCKYESYVNGKYV